MLARQIPIPEPNAFSGEKTAIRLEGRASTSVHNMNGIHRATSSVAQTPTCMGATCTKEDSKSNKPLTTTKPDASMLMTLRSSPLSTLPSLLRYVDHELLQTIALHNRPACPAAKCPVCKAYWNAPITLPNKSLTTNLLPPPTLSTFLPITPCTHWLHYRCLIARACDPCNPAKDKCPTCNMQLFQWDGISALTLATRTNLTLIDANPRGYLTPADTLTPSRFQPSDTAEYVSDCVVIDSLIHQAFFAHLSISSPYADGSPDLVQAYYDVVSELDRRGLPKARWLSWGTRTGFLLFGMLVVIKMRRFLVQGQGGIVGTEAWEFFEESGRQLQRRILGELQRLD